MPDLAAEHPSLLPKEQPYLRIERTFIFVDLSGFTAYTRAQGADRAAAVLTYFRHETRSVAARRNKKVSDIVSRRRDGSAAEVSAEG